MTGQTLALSPKYKAFLRCRARLEVLEGTTAAGKTTVGLYKFMLMCAASPKKLHLLAAEDVGTAEKNIIQRELGVADDFGVLADYRGSGSKEYKMPHIALHAPDGDRIVFVVGYRDRTRWKDALGGQYGGLFIDEVNTAHMDFVREAVMRADYTMMTLNPDDPDLPVYGEYINHCRPLSGWESDTPREILDALSEEARPGWVHWFFTFSDNAGLPESTRERIVSSVPVGTKLWKNKIQGLRGRATGLVFSNFDRKTHVKPDAWARQFVRRPGKDRQQEVFTTFTCGVDTAYSQKSPDTIAMAFVGITNRGRCVVLDERVYNNAQLRLPLAPSDTVRNLVDFLNRNREAWGFARSAFIDSADQATITEAAKYKRQYGSVYSFTPAWKKEKIIDRINNQLGWMAPGGGEPCFYVLEGCEAYIRELETYSWKEDRDNEPEDGRDHMINAVQYAWLPYEKQIRREG